MSLAFLKRSAGRRTAIATAAATGLTGALLGIAPSPAAQAEADPDNQALTAAVGWLDVQRADGRILTGNLVDAYFGLQDAGVDQARIDAVAADVVADLPGYYTTDYEYPAGSHYTGISAGGVAKALALVTDSGGDATNANGAGLDLEDAMEDRVLTAAPNVGRIADESLLNGAPDATDWGNSIGQAYAYRGLYNVNSPLAADVRDFLLDQQCDSGFFRLYFNADKSAPEQGCPEGAAQESADTTALVLILLDDYAGEDPLIASALDDAEAWLAGLQKADGSFPGEDGANSNTTGLAGWALGVRGNDAAAAKAATAVRALQMTGTACDGAAVAEAGAVAFTTQSLADGIEFGIDTGNRWEWIGATVQAFPVLAWAPAATRDLQVTAPKFVKAGAKATLKVKGLAPGERGCAAIGKNRASVVSTTGVATAKVTAPDVERPVTVSVTATNQAEGTQVTVLKAAKKLGLSFAKTVKAGEKQKVVVKKLAAGESVTVTVGTKKVVGKANAKGLFTAKVKVTKKGATKVTVRGQYAGRKAAGAFKVA